MREKLIELLGADVCKHDCCDDREHQGSTDACVAELKAQMADHLDSHTGTAEGGMTMTCNDCLHYEVCKHHDAVVDFPVDDGVCRFFEDSNKFAEQNRNGCEYCLEDREGYRRMVGAFYISNPYHGRNWTINTGHCKPREIRFCPMCGRKLSEPSKEDANG